MEIAKGTDDWHSFNVVRVSENDANGAPYEGQFATSFEISGLKDADDVMTQRKWVEVIFQKLIARGIAIALDELPRRYVSREFLTL